MKILTHEELSDLMGELEADQGLPIDKMKLIIRSHFLLLGALG